jgi:hypothetical protein
MEANRSKIPPRWLFTILAVGGFWASGIYLGMIRAGGSSTGDVVRVIAFGIFGVLMLWGALGKR